MPLRKPTVRPDAHLEPQISSFGMMQMPHIEGSIAYGGRVTAGESDVDVQVYESSTGAPAIWIKVEGDAKAAIVLLPLGRAHKLAQQIEYLIEHHHTKEPS